MNENMTGNETIRGEEEVLEVMPLVDILDGADGVTMWFEVPGANSGTVNIEVKNHVMSLNAESSLRRNGKRIVFKRRFQLSDGVDIDNLPKGSGPFSLCGPEPGPADFSPGPPDFSLFQREGGCFFPFHRRERYSEGALPLNFRKRPVK